MAASQSASEGLAQDIDALVHGEHGDPFALLGMHAGGDGLDVRTFQPEAARVWVVDSAQGKAVGELERLRPEGFFAGRLPRKRPFAYRLRLETPHGRLEVDDPYRFPPLLGDMDAHLIAEGRHLRLYERLGAHPRKLDGVAGVAFAVWAPNARRVSVVGDFNAWDGRRHPMRHRHECGVWELFLPGLKPGTLYKYEIRGPHGELLPLKADPMGFRTQRSPETASIVHGLPQWSWEDAAWMQARAAAHARDAPVSIYECHLGSWMRHAEAGNRYLDYEELAERLVPYVKEMGFTHLELLPVSEHPFDGSWGYQPVGLYAPTSRFGAPEGFARFVERCHRERLGVLLDWVPAHFPTDPHGLGRFDGTPLYEHADPRLGYHPDWDTLVYDFGRYEVANFLLANALFWMEAYHADGLRVDAVASMLYLDYSRGPGEWLPNVYGGNQNLEAIAFLRRMNELVYEHHGDATTVAEESTAWPGVSRPTCAGGLGFGYKWNMGWMHDTLGYMRRDPYYRQHHHGELTFGPTYAFSENFVLPLSHDEVVHRKGSLIGKMPGDRWQRFANLRAYFGFMFAHPGKKLLFMGGEFAQEREWNHDRGLDWELLEDPAHKGVQLLVRDLNQAYRQVPALHELDCEAAGFEWVEADDAARSVLAFLRFGRDRVRPALAVCNFTPVPRHGYRVGVPGEGFYHELVNTDAQRYGGRNFGNMGGVTAEPVPSHGRPWSLALTLPPLATLLFERQP